MRSKMAAASVAAMILHGQAVTAQPSEGDLDFRWLNNAGFEITLSSGARVLIDPWLDSARFNPLPLEEIEGVDYILLSHTHSDHAEDIGAIQKRFPEVRIFVGLLSAEPLVRSQNLDTSRLYKVSDGQIFQFDDIRIEAIAGRHTESALGNHLEWDEEGRLTAQGAGTLDMFQYMITAPDGTSFMAWGGTPSVDNAYRLAGLQPDVAAVHISPKQDFDILARILVEMEPEIVIPHHYDIWPFILETRPEEIANFPEAVRPLTAANVIERMMPYVSEQLQAGGMRADYFVPEPHAWYRYDEATTSVTAIDEETTK
jgi:L-ascorbate metabolism protein UlaG (beta-lactamase superfamily)